jgi:hypothetical protein
MTNYSHFVPMMNDALREAWMELPGNQASYIPFIDFDPDTCKFNMNIERTQPGRGTKYFLIQDCMNY